MMEKLKQNGRPDGEQQEAFMRECIVLAKRAAADGESSVGSVLVKDNVIIARGIEAVKRNNDFTFHAEIECIRNASRFLNTRQLAGCTLYTTHEPCIMCSYVIRQAAISRVVLGLLTGEKGGYESGYSLLTDTSIRSWSGPPVVVTGFLAEECRQLK